MTKKIKLWLVTAIFTVGAISTSGLINPCITVAAPTKELKSPSTADKLIFFFKGGEKRQQLRLETTGKRRTRVAGSRGCGADIVALMPRSNLGVTSSANPTFWFYLPPSDLDLKSLTFKVFGLANSTDLVEQEIWTTQLPLKSQKIAIGLLQVPYQGKLLTSGTYRWEFSYQQVGCNNPQVLSGYVQKENHPNIRIIKQTRESLSAKADTFAEAKASPTRTERLRQQLQLYAINGIWHELLTELITLRQQQPNNSQLVIDFRSLLFESEDIKYILSSDRQQVDRDLMENIVNAPLINCCQFVTSK
jgi:hypothetical protein